MLAHERVVQSSFRDLMPKEDFRRRLSQGWLAAWAPRFRRKIQTAQPLAGIASHESAIPSCNRQFKNWIFCLRAYRFHFYPLTDELTPYLCLTKTAMIPSKVKKRIITNATNRLRATRFS